MKPNSRMRNKSQRNIYDGPYANVFREGQRGALEAPRVRAYSADSAEGPLKTPPEWNRFAPRPISRPGTPARRP